MSLSIKRLDTSDEHFQGQFDQLISWSERENPVLNQRVQDIVNDVQHRGDEALLEYTNQFDHRNIKASSELVLSAEIMREAWDRLAAEVQDTLSHAAERIRAFHADQAGSLHQYTDNLGNRLGTRQTPIRRVGVYVPGGQASYPSTVLMTVIPAQVAEVQNIVVVVPAPNGELNDVMLGALHLVGIESAYSVGGAQAVAALAFGTQTIPQVDKIVGPGGSWVAAAKKQVFGPVGIESIAGPSEILVIADGSVDAKWIAWDLMSQAEHDAHAQSILITPNRDYLNSVAEHIQTNLQTSPRSDIITQSLESRGALIRSKNLEEAIALSNQVAPEHLQLAVQDPDSYLDQVSNAGAIFLGAYSAEALGDYVAGPSHVLPTFGTARYASALGVQDFQKRSSVIGITEKGAEQLGRIAGNFADLEGLHAHAQAARIRVKGYDHNQ